MGKQTNYLPNTNTPASNYPITNKSELLATVQEYPSHNQATDRYLDQNTYEKKWLKYGQPEQDWMEKNFLDKSNTAKKYFGNPKIRKTYKRIRNKIMSGINR